MPSLPAHLPLPHRTDEEAGIPRREVTCFRVVRKVGLGLRFLDSKTRVYYVMVERKSPHSRSQNNSKKWAKPLGAGSPGFYPSKGRHIVSHFGGHCNRNHGALILGHGTVMPLAWNARWLVVPMNQLLAPACLQSKERASHAMLPLLCKPWVLYNYCGDLLSP